ncbi:hypothetical protein Asp14428_00290 [Actinoplanes sp. NBRC 14428]|nr:hypothetical protein Asp14428_00290 [Actinoplanes sp. NBRC 14428]
MTAPHVRVLAAATVLAAAGVLAGPAPLAVAGGLLLGFVLPGAALTGALLRGRTLTAVERTLLAPALSLATLVVGGLLVHLCRLPLNRWSWTVATGGIALLALAVQVVLPGPAVTGPPAEEAAPVPAGSWEAAAVAEGRTVVMTVAPHTSEEPADADDKARRIRLVKQLLPLVLVLAVLGGASWLSFGTSRETYETTVTALSAAPSGPVDAAGDRVVAMAASGLVAADGPYTLTVTGAAGTAPIRRIITPGRDGAWSENLTLPGDERVTVNLYRAGDTAAYRTLAISAVE